MASTSGTVTTSVDIREALAAGATRLAGYTIPVGPSLQTSYSNGSAAGMVSKVYQAAFTIVGATLDIDLTTVVCADGSVGFGNVREVLVFNDDATAGGARVLTMGLGTNPINYWLGGTNPVAYVHPSAPLRFLCPIQTAGWVVDSTRKVIRLDSGAFTIAGRIVVLGN